MSGLLWLIAALCLSGRCPAARHGGHRSPSRRRDDPYDRVRLTALAGALAVTALCAILLAGVWIALSPVLGAATFHLLRTVKPAQDADPADTALLLELAGHVLAGGMPPDRALIAVAAAARQVDEERWAHIVVPFEQVGRSLQLGADPSTAWARLAGHDVLREFGQAAERSAHSGSRLGAVISESAVRLRRGAADAADVRAQRTGVWALLPLGLCFLPAFVCLGIVPFAGGIAAQFLPGTR